MREQDASKRTHHVGEISVMTVREVSAYLQVHPTTIYRLLRRNEIPAFHIGSDWRFSIEAIDRWCSSRIAIADRSAKG